MLETVFTMKVHARSELLSFMVISAFEDMLVCKKNITHNLPPRFKWPRKMKTLTALLGFVLVLHTVLEIIV